MLCFSLWFVVVTRGREWYLPFEQFRGRLVKLLDDVLDQMDTDPTFQHFHLDGQMVCGLASLCLDSVVESM